VIGDTVLERAHWGSGTNHQSKQLMLEHAFRGARTAYFHVSPGNVRSQRALTQIGARLDRQEDVLVGGVMTPRMIYSMQSVPE
jgi:RimJ/RimL family protein N-acetyltransferase